MNEEQLTKLLDYVKSTASEPGNEWFLEELQKQCGVLKESAIETRLKNIETYLQIDGIKIIEYSEIEDQAVREQLNRDCVEMHRHRLGKVNHKINFDEFCRYAHYQAEEMINYYLNVRFSKNIKEMIDFLESVLKEHEKKTFFREAVMSVTHIKYTYKLKYFIQEIISQSCYGTLRSANSLRNEISHRSSLDSMKDDNILNIVNNKIGGKDLTPEDWYLIDKSKVIKFRRDQNFEKIVLALNELKEKIISELSLCK